MHSFFAREVWRDLLLGSSKAIEIKVKKIYPTYILSEIKEVLQYITRNGKSALKSRNLKLSIQFENSLLITCSSDKKCAQHTKITSLRLLSHRPSSCSHWHKKYITSQLCLHLNLTKNQSLEEFCFPIRPTVLLLIKNKFIEVTPILH